MGIGTENISEKLHINAGNVRTNTTYGYYGSFVQAISNAGLKLEMMITQDLCSLKMMEILVSEKKHQLKNFTLLGV